MPRPPKCRQVRFQPGFTLFKPHGIPARQLSSVTLAFDELEALRLKDLEGLPQGEIATQMGVSQSTVHRMLVGARQKVTDAIVRGKLLQIEGGTFEMAHDGMRQFQCGACRHVWESSSDVGQSGHDMSCPTCESDSVQRTDQLSETEDKPAETESSKKLK